MRTPTWIRALLPSRKHRRRRARTPNESVNLYLTRLEDRRLLTASRVGIDELDAVKAEGDNGFTGYTFEVTRSRHLHHPTYLGYHVYGSGDDPASPADFGGENPTGIIHFDRWQRTQVLNIDVLGDLDYEADERFTVEIFPLHKFPYVHIVDSTAHGWILNDDYAADLEVELSDGLESAVPGTNLTYTLTVSNNGPTGVDKVQLDHHVPEQLTNVIYTSQVVQGHASGNSSDLTGDARDIFDTLSMEPGSRVTYTVTGTIAPNATGILFNKAYVRGPENIVEINPHNNTATDSDTLLTPQVDLEITKTDEVTKAVPGLSELTYTIVVTNHGPSFARDVAIRDVFSDALTDVTYTSETCGCVFGNTASGVGDLEEVVSLAPGGTVTYTVTANIVPWATGTISNTAEVETGSGTTDINPHNNRATDNNTRLYPHVDLRITKSDGVLAAVPGATTLTYTIEVVNDGPSRVSGATIRDAFPAELTNVRYTSVSSGYATGHTTSGTGDIHDVVTLDPDARIVYTVTADIVPWATGTLENKAEVSAPYGTIEINADNNTATDNDTRLYPHVDLQISKDDGIAQAVPGATTLTYTIVVSNAGPSFAAGAFVVDDLPSELIDAEYTSVASDGASGNTAHGYGDIRDVVNLAPGASITYTVAANIDPTATGLLINSATVQAPDGTIEMRPFDNVAADNDTELTPVVDLKITKDDRLTEAIPGQTRLTYTIVVSNAGPSFAAGAFVVDDLPSELIDAEYTSVASAGASGNTAEGSGDIRDVVNLAPGASITYTVTANIDPTATGLLINSATVQASTDAHEADSSNNVATDNDTELTTVVDLQITKSDGIQSAIPGQTELTYTIVVTNAGPSFARSAAVIDDFSSALINVSYTSVAANGATGNTPSGQGSILDLVNLAPGSSITYTVTADVASTATGTLSNTAEVAVPPGVTDFRRENNTATDGDTVLTPVGDLQITIDNGVTTVVPGETVTYTIVVTNAGPSFVTGAVVLDNLPPELLDASYTSIASDGAEGNTPLGQGNINDTVNLASGASITYTLTGTVSPDTARPLENTATIIAPSSVQDPDLVNNSSTDTDSVPPRISIFQQDSDVFEGQPGDVTPVTFLVSRSGDLTQPTVLDFTVLGAAPDAADGNDFGGDLPSGNVVLGPGETSQLLTVSISGDLEFEANEEFSVFLSAPNTTAVFDVSNARGVIRDDDLLAALAAQQINERDDDDGGDGDDAELQLAVVTASTIGEILESGEGDTKNVVVDAGEGEDSSTSKNTTRREGEEEEQKAQLGDIRLFFVIVNVDGEEGNKEYELPSELLEGDRLLQLFKKFPNGHYRVYLEKDRSVRKLYDLHVYDQELVTPETLETGSGTEDQARLDQGPAAKSLAERIPDGESAPAPVSNEILDVAADLRTAVLLRRRLADVPPQNPRPWAERVDDALQFQPNSLSRLARAMREVGSISD
jgi:uncharacterized repeat protein (TIGR01451 family)